MASAAKQPKGGLTPGKLGLIIVLSVILLVVLVVQFGGGDSQPAAARREPRRTRSPNEAPSPSEQSGNDSRAVDDQEAATWPKFSVQEVLAHNPFVLPAALRPEGGFESEASEAEAVETVATADEDARRQAVLELRRRQREFMASLKAQGVDMIVMTAQGRVARVGNLSLRVGDRIKGLRVQQINSEGIVFAEEPTFIEQTGASQL